MKINYKTNIQYIKIFLIVGNKKYYQINNIKNENGKESNMHFVA